MGSNVEIKSRASDYERQMKIAAGLTSEEPVVLVQVDTYFGAGAGRLKLRECGGEAELISYERADCPGPRESHYTREPIARPRSLAGTFTTSLGVLGVVRKTRTVFLVDGDRIHFDDVEGLGRFIEIEAIVREGRGAPRARKTLEKLMKKLGIKPADLVERSYLDLMVASDTNGGTSGDGR